MPKGLPNEDKEFAVTRTFVWFVNAKDKEEALEMSIDMDLADLVSEDVEET